MTRRSLLGALPGSMLVAQPNGAPRNIVLMHADQLRADCVGCYGNRIVRTPHMDRLASEGARYAWAFSQHPQCVPSRSAMFTGRYPHANGAISNYTAMNPGERTFAEHLRGHGYRTIATGKLHQFADKQSSGFTDTMLSEGQHSEATDPEVLHSDYKNWLKANGYWDTVKKSYATHGTAEYKKAFQARVNNTPAEAYIDTWAGDRAVDFIRSQPASQPFFLFTGFPSPHAPFEPPEPYASMYKPDDMPLPSSFRASLEEKPPQHEAYRRRGRPGYDYDRLDAASLRRVTAYYYAKITLVDAQVGKILAALAARGMAGNTLVIITSDHGELLGQHGLLLKSIDEFPMLYDVGLRVPLLIRTPGAPPGRVIETPVELIDLCPTSLEWAGLQVPPEAQGFSLLASARGGAAPKREYVFAESGSVKMLRGERYKLVHYPGQPYGELYDLKTDPDEANNLYAKMEHRELRNRMTQALLDRLIAAEGPLHGESLRGPAYWRRLYRAPFEETGKK